VNQREKEQYLREYALLKQQGKPFFPYAVAKDSLMAVVTMLVIIVMAIVLGAELGPKADPTTTTYTPRPEWYFYFLFELLKVIKPPELVPLATIGIPTICMILLFLLPFYDRNPERHPLKRPIATTAGVADLTGYTDYGRVWQEFAQTAALGVTGYPTLLGLAPGRRPAVLSLGCLPFADVVAALDRFLASAAAAPGDA